MRRILRIVGTGALVVFVFLSAVWANLAIAYQLPGSAAVRIGVCLILNLIALAALVAVVRHRHWRAVLIYAVALALLFAWSGSISASNGEAHSDAQRSGSRQLVCDREICPNRSDKNWAADVIETEAHNRVSNRRSHPINKE